MSINWNVCTIYTFDVDSIPECPLCSMRSDFVEHPENPNIQSHTCLGCGFEFIVEIVGSN